MIAIQISKAALQQSTESNSVTSMF